MGLMEGLSAHIGGDPRRFHRGLGGRWGGALRLTAVSTPRIEPPDIGTRSRKGRIRLPSSHSTRSGRGGGSWPNKGGRLPLRKLLSFFCQLTAEAALRCGGIHLRFQDQNTPSSVVSERIANWKGNYPRFPLVTCIKTNKNRMWVVGASRWGGEGPTLTPSCCACQGTQGGATAGAAFHIVSGRIRRGPRALPNEQSSCSVFGCTGPTSAPAIHCWLLVLRGDVTAPCVFVLPAGGSASGAGWVRRSGVGRPAKKNGKQGGGTHGVANPMTGYAPMLIGGEVRCLRGLCLGTFSMGRSGKKPFSSSLQVEIPRVVGQGEGGLFMDSREKEIFCRAVKWLRKKGGCPSRARRSG